MTWGGLINAPKSPSIIPPEIWVVRTTQIWVVKRPHRTTVLLPPRALCCQILPCACRLRWKERQDGRCHKGSEGSGVLPHVHAHGRPEYTTCAQVCPFFAVQGSGLREQVWRPGPNPQCGSGYRNHRGPRHRSSEPSQISSGHAAPPA
jgi:hypothetical protein